MKKTTTFRRGFARRPYAIAAVAAVLDAGAALRMATPLAAQEPTFSADVKLVNVLATVHDRKGDIVRSLTKNDFLLEEDGRPQEIRYFAQESDLPLTLG